MAREAGGRDFTWIEGLAFCLSYIGIQIASESFNQWGLYFYSPSEGVGRTVYISMAIVGYVFVIATCWDAGSTPLAGVWSDATNTRPGRFRLLRIHGRRRPFVFWGSILMTFTFLAAWYPPVEGTSNWNFAYASVLLCLHWTFFSITTVPLLALIPEVAVKESERIRLSVWVAVGMVVGMAIVNAGSGVFVRLLDAPHAGDYTSPVGYRRLAMIYAVVMVALFQFQVWAVRERFNPGADHKNAPALAGFFEAARNRPFMLYFISVFLYNIGLLAVQRILPYWAELGLGGNEDTVTLLLLPYLTTCLLSYAVIPAIARRIGLKWTFMLGLVIITSSLPMLCIIGMFNTSTTIKTVLGALAFAYTGLGQGVLFVVPWALVGELIDYNERQSGHRREALYYALNNFASKASMAFSVLLATQSMRVWGHSAAHPQGVYYVGPIAWVCGLLGCIAMLFYPTMPKADFPEGELAEATAHVPPPS